MKNQWLGKEKEDLKIYTKKDFFMEFAPSFNFEYGQDQLIDKGLELGLITKVSGDKYSINQNKTNLKSYNR